MPAFFLPLLQAAAFCALIKKTPYVCNRPYAAAAPPDKKTKAKETTP
jgi:hypothetical protein